MIDCVCKDCGHEQHTDMGVPCEKCGSLVVSLDVVKELFGDNWKETCFGTEDE